MRVLLIIAGCMVAIVLGAVALTTLFPGVDTGASPEMQKAILREVIDGKVIVDAAMPSSNALWLGVIDDGTDRYGLAMYGCEVLRQHHVRGGRVKIMDAVAAKRDEFRELKTVFCK